MKRLLWLLPLIPAILVGQQHTHIKDLPRTNALPANFWVVGNVKQGTNETSITVAASALGGGGGGGGGGNVTVPPGENAGFTNGVWYGGGLPLNVKEFGALGVLVFVTKAYTTNANHAFTIEEQASRSILGRSLAVTNLDDPSQFFVGTVSDWAAPHTVVASANLPFTSDNAIAYIGVDDRAAIQAAFDTITNTNAYLPYGRQTLYFPEGKYPVYGTLNFINRSYWRVMGYGSTIFGGVSGVPVIDALGGGHYQFSGLTIDTLPGVTPSTALVYGRRTDDDGFGYYYAEDCLIDGDYSIANVYTVAAELEEWHRSTFRASHGTTPHYLFMSGKTSTNKFGSVTSPTFGDLTATGWGGNGFKLFDSCNFLYWSTVQAGTPLRVEFAQTCNLLNCYVSTAMSTNQIEFAKNVEGLTITGLREEWSYEAPQTGIYFADNSRFNNVNITGSAIGPIVGEDGDCIQWHVVGNTWFGRGMDELHTDMTFVNGTNMFTISDLIDEQLPWETSIYRPMWLDSDGSYDDPLTIVTNMIPPHTVQTLDAFPFAGTAPGSISPWRFAGRTNFNVAILEDSVISFADTQYVPAGRPEYNSHYVVRNRSLRNYFGTLHPSHLHLPDTAQTYDHIDRNINGRMFFTPPSTDAFSLSSTNNTWTPWAWNGVRFSGASGYYNFAAVRGGAYSGGGGTGWLGLYTGQFDGAFGTLRERVHVDHIGNVGIDTTNPAVKLDVHGVGRFLDDNGGLLMVGSSNNVSALFVMAPYKSALDTQFGWTWQAGASSTGYELRLINNGNAYMQMKNAAIGADTAGYTTWNNTHRFGNLFVTPTNTSTVGWPLVFTSTLGDTRSQQLDASVGVLDGSVTAAKLASGAGGSPVGAPLVSWTNQFGWGYGASNTVFVSNNVAGTATTILGGNINAGTLLNSTVTVTSANCIPDVRGTYRYAGEADGNHYYTNGPYIINSRSAGTQWIVGTNLTTAVNCFYTGGGADAPTLSGWSVIGTYSGTIATTLNYSGASTNAGTLFNEGTFSVGSPQNPTFVVNPATTVATLRGPLNINVNGATSPSVPVFSVYAGGSQFGLGVNAAEGLLLIGVGSRVTASSASFVSVGPITAPGYFLTTNPIPALTLTAGRAYYTNLAANITLAPFAGVPPDGEWKMSAYFTNSNGSTSFSVTQPNGVKGMGANSLGTTARFVTNMQSAWFRYEGYGQMVTNFTYDPVW